jgi:hypothetical protein
MDLAPDGLGAGQFLIAIALLHDELFPDLGGGQPGVQALRLERRVGLALPIDEGFDVTEQMGQVFFGAFAPPQTKGIGAADAGGQLVHPFADGHAVPPQLALGPPLPSGSEYPHRSCHEETPIHAM